MYITMGNTNSYKRHDDMMNYIEDRLDNLAEKVNNNSNLLRQITDINDKMSHNILEIKKKILNNHEDILEVDKKILDHKNMFEKLFKQDNLQITNDIINNVISESDTWLPDDTEKTLLKNSVHVILSILQKRLLLESEK